MQEYFDRLFDRIDEAGCAINNARKSMAEALEHFEDERNIARVLAQRRITVAEITRLLVGPVECEQYACQEPAVCWAAPHKDVAPTRLCEQHRAACEKSWTETQGGFICVMFDELRGE